MNKCVLLGCLSALLLFSCSKKVEKSVPDPGAAAPVPSNDTIQVSDTRVYLRAEDHGTQGRDTFSLEGNTYRHINVNGLGQRWDQTSILTDTAPNSVWVMRTRGQDYKKTPIDQIDSFQVRKFDGEVVVSRWLNGQPAGPRRIPRLKKERAD